MEQRGLFDADARFRAEIADMDAELLSIQRGVMQEHRLSVMRAVEGFHKEHKRRKRTRKPAVRSTYGQVKRSERRKSALWP